MDMSMHTPGTRTYAMVPTHKHKPQTYPLQCCCHTHAHAANGCPLHNPGPAHPPAHCSAAPLPPHITNRGPGAVTQQYGGGAVPGGERPEGPGEAYGQ